MRRLLIGASAFLIGGTAAAALSAVGEPRARAVAAAHVTTPAIAATRVALPLPTVRAALAKGTILHPVATVLNVRGPMHYGDYRWDDAGVPAGPTWVRVDLKSQILSVFRSGHEIGTAVILYGADGNPTPTGKFPVLAKLKDHRSATYDAPMPYTLRLTGDGVSIHGSNVRWGFATHGCVGVPAGFAAKLFDAVSVGSQVLIVDGDSPPPNHSA
jgi:lipoprotein-anchoring transpeptidase ErfK/SrfK